MQRAERDLARTRLTTADGGGPQTGAAFTAAITGLRQHSTRYHLPRPAPPRRSPAAPGPGRRRSTSRGPGRQVRDPPGRPGVLRRHAAGSLARIACPDRVTVGQICAVAGDLLEQPRIWEEVLSAGPVAAELITAASWRGRAVVAG